MSDDGGGVDYGGGTLKMMMGQAHRYNSRSPSPSPAQPPSTNNGNSASSTPSTSREPVSTSLMGRDLRVSSGGGGGGDGGRGNASGDYGSKSNEGDANAAQLSQNSQPQSNESNPQSQSQSTSSASKEKSAKQKQPKWLVTPFGTFIFGDLIGRGAQSKVFRAMSTAGTFVAVKKINTIGVDPAILDAVKREVQILQMVEHPNIIKVIGLHKTPKSLCLVLEYAENGSLDRLLKEFSALPEPLVLAFAKQILSALACLHAKNIIHRDIKAGNCLVSKVDGSIKLADFGISTVMQNDNKNFSLVGSPFWMAPEVIQNNGHNTLSDIWGSGFNAMFRITQCDIPSPTNCSTELQDFLKLALQKDPKDRPSASKLALHPWITGDKSVGSVTSLIQLQEIERLQQEEEQRKEQQRQLQEQRRQAQLRQSMELRKSRDQSAGAQESPQDMYDSLRSSGLPRVDNILATLLDPSLKKGDAQVIHDTNSAERRTQRPSAPPQCFKLDIRGVEEYNPGEIPSSTSAFTPPSPLLPKVPAPASALKLPTFSAHSIVSPHTRHSSHTPPQVPALQLNLLGSNPPPTSPPPEQQPKVVQHPLSAVQPSLQRIPSSNRVRSPALAEFTNSPRQRAPSGVPPGYNPPSQPRTPFVNTPSSQPSPVPFSPRQSNPSGAHLPIYVNPSITPSAVAASIFRAPSPTSSALVANILRGPTPDSSRRRHISMATPPSTAPKKPPEESRPASASPPPEKKPDKGKRHHHHKHEHHHHHTPEITKPDIPAPHHMRKRSQTCAITPPASSDRNKSPRRASVEGSTVDMKATVEEPVMEKAARTETPYIEHISETQLEQQVMKMKEYLANVGRDRAPSYPSIQIKPHLVLSLEPAMVKQVPCSRIWSLLLVKGVAWVGGGEGTVLLWEAETFNQFSVVQLHDTRVYCMLLVGDCVYVSSEEAFIFIVSAQSLAFHKVKVHDKGHAVIKCMVPVSSSTQSGIAVSSTGELSGLGSGGAAPHVWSFGCGMSGTQISILYKNKLHGQISLPHQVNCVCVQDNTVWMGCYGDLVYIPNASNFNFTGSGVVEVKESDLHLKQLSFSRRRKVGSIISVGVHILAACGNSIFICHQGTIVNEIKQESEIERLCLFQNLILSCHFNGTIACWDPICNYRQVRVLSFPQSPTTASTAPTASASSTDKPGMKKETTSAESADPNFGCGKRLATVFPDMYSSRFGECGVKSILPVVLEDSAAIWAGNTGNLLCVWRPSLPPSLIASASVGPGCGSTANPSFRALTSTATNPRLFANPLNPLAVPAPPVFPISGEFSSSTAPQTPRQSAATPSLFSNQPPPCSPRLNNANANTTSTNNSTYPDSIARTPMLLPPPKKDNNTRTPTPSLNPPAKSPRRIKSPTVLPSPSPHVGGGASGSSADESDIKHHHRHHHHHNNSNEHNTTATAAATGTTTTSNNNNNGSSNHRHKHRHNQNNNQSASPTPSPSPSPTPSPTPSPVPSESFGSCGGSGHPPGSASPIATTTTTTTTVITQTSVTSTAVIALAPQTPRGVTGRRI
ncbi:STE/STE11/CDC15 protein kinase Cdc7 [Pelomyxa schiedti]|nr:STE/STE11/CDC15 protein kinase Cdc7 [Pelomyxa schiedti]